jgi:hypothetical protein
MATIDAGPGAINRAAHYPNDYTLISNTNPIAASGTITSVELWFSSYGTNATGVKVAIFSKSGSVFTPRSVANIGNVTKGAKQTFSVSLDAEAGDYIGLYWAAYAAYLENDWSGGGWWNSPPGDYTGGAATYNFMAGAEISIYGTGLAYEFGVVAVTASANVIPQATLRKSGNAPVTVSASLAVIGKVVAWKRATIIVTGNVTPDWSSQWGSTEIVVAGSIAPMSGKVTFGMVVSTAAISLTAVGSGVASALADIIAAFAIALNRYTGDAALAVAVSVTVAPCRMRYAATSITIFAPVTAVATTYLAQLFGYTGTISPGDTLVIDCDAKTIELNGVNVVRYMTGKFPQLYAGTNELRWHDDGVTRTIAVDEDHDPRFL